MNYTENNSILQEEKFQDHKLMNNDMILKLRKTGFKKESEQVLHCGSYLVFSKQEHQQTKETRNRLKEANFCKFRFCSTCNWRRNRNINRELLDAFTSIESDRSVSYIFLTLTIKNVATSDLRATVKHMNDSFKRMSKTKAFKDVVLGHFKALEIVGDKTPPGEVHPHFHIILIVSNTYFKGNYYLSQKKWTEMWQKALRVDYTPVVDVRRIKAKETKSGKKLTALQSAVFEVAKYSVKHTELTQKPDDEFVTIMLQTRKMRFFSTGGILKEKINLLKCDEELINFRQEIEEMWQEIEELIYEWKDGNYRLKEIKPPQKKEES